jgi:hydrogenase expression/formation protein HypC
MCLAIPMLLIEVKPNGIGIVELNGLQQEVNLGLVEDARPGRYVIVHAGFAIETLDEVQARELIDLFAQLAAQIPNPPTSERTG